MRFSMLWAMRRLGRLGAEAVDERLQPGDLLGLAARPSWPGGPRPRPAAARYWRVGALVLDEVPDGVLGRAVEVEHAGDRLVEQFEVVADHEQRAAVLRAGTPSATPWRRRRGGSSARRGTARRCRRTGCGPARPAAARHPTARRSAGRCGRRPMPSPAAMRPRLALGRVPAVDAEQLLGAGVAGDVALVGALLHRDAQLLDALELVVDAAPGQDVGDGGAAVEHAGDARVLRQVAEAALAHDRARRPARPRRRAPGTGSSCRRRCGRRGRPCRGASR